MKIIISVSFYKLPMLLPLYNQNKSFHTQQVVLGDAKSITEAVGTRRKMESLTLLVWLVDFTNFS